MNIIICPKCKGKGTVTDWIGILGMTIMGPVLWLGEKDHGGDRSITRKWCTLCKGKKFLDMDKVLNDRR